MEKLENGPGPDDTPEQLKEKMMASDKRTGNRVVIRFESSDGENKIPIDHERKEY